MTDELKNAIITEIEYQNERWGYGPEYQHSLVEWLVIIEKLINDAKLSWYNSASDPSTKDYLRKVAATAIQGMTVCGFNNRTALKG